MNFAWPECLVSIWLRDGVVMKASLTMLRGWLRIPRMDITHRVISRAGTNAGRHVNYPLFCTILTQTEMCRQI
jgi:hypothetical protein